ncbi:MAG: DUF5110 domain-containing protein, partial [Clostridia bacterium]|nr:DUF5110 domain-containing protein [Clostridia bacterium]
YDIAVECYEKTGKSVAYLMCEPVLPKNTSERTVFIPDGTWINVFTGEETVGPKTITVTGGTDEMPVFVRKGAAIPVSDVISPMTGADWSDLSVNIYGLSDTSFTLYEDDGMTEGYLDGTYRKTNISIDALESDNWQITIGAADGDFDTDYTVRKVSLRVHSDRPITATLSNGEALNVTPIQYEAGALPFNNSGASGLSHVYEIEVDTALAETTTVIVTEGISGDINGDGIISLYDTLGALNAVLNNKPCPAADINADKILTTIDVIQSLKKISA